MTSLAQWRAMPIKTWNVYDKKTGTRFTVEAKNRANAMAVLQSRWMLSPNETELRAIVSVQRKPKEAKQ